MARMSVSRNYLMPGKSAWLERVAAGVLLLTFLPTLSFLGHWSEILGGSQVPQASASVLVDAAAQQADQVDHSRHCHTDLAACSAQPLPAGLGLLATRETLLRPPSLLSTESADRQTRASLGHTISPPAPPPRSS